jgi:hypothetical protein
VSDSPAAVDPSVTVPPSPSTTRRLALVVGWLGAVALVLVTVTFGWTGGKELVRQSYREARASVLRVTELSSTRTTD